MDHILQTKQSMIEDAFSAIDAQLWWTTTPHVPFELPCSAKISLEDARLKARCDGMNLDDPDLFVPVTVFLDWPAAEIMSVRIHVVPDVDAEWFRDVDFSTAVVRHVDVLDVLPYFETAFRTAESYDFRLLAKRLKESGVTVDLDVRTGPYVAPPRRRPPPVK